MHLAVNIMVSSILTPNLSDFLPVFVNSCPPASTPGLNLIATGAIAFISFATSSSAINSLSDSTLNDRILLLIPAAISAFDFPTPEKIIF